MRTQRSRSTAFKTKKCKQCGDLFSPFQTTQKVCSVPCSTQYARDQKIAKAKKDQADYSKQCRKDLRDLNRKDRRWQLKQTQAAFNKLRKLQELKWYRDRGLEPECISCGKTKMDWCCGHFKTVGASPGLRFNPLNTYLQCNKYCNMSLSGNIEGNSHTRGYKKGLAERFDEKYASYVITYCEQEYSSGWPCDELEKMRKCFNAEIRDLEAQLSLDGVDYAHC